MLNYPNPPLTVGQVYTSTPQSWVWDGQKWTNNNAGLPAYLPLSGGTVQGNLTVQGTTTLGAATATTVVGSDNSTNIATTAWVRTYSSGNYLPLTGGSVTGNVTVSGNVIGNNSVQSNGVYFQNSGGYFYTPQPFQSGSNIVANGNVYVGGTTIYWQSNGSYMYSNQNVQSAGQILANSDLVAAGSVYAGGGGGVRFYNNSGYFYSPNSMLSNGNIVAQASMYVGGTGGPYWSNNSGWMYSPNGVMSAGDVLSFSGNGCYLSQLGVRYMQYTNNQMVLWWTGGLCYVVVDNSNQGWITFNGCDRNLKRNFGPIGRDCLAAINAIELESFDWPQTVPSRKRINPQAPAQHARFEDQPLLTRHWGVGYTAQQVREVIPEAVPEPPSGGYLGVDLQMMVAHLIGAVKQLSDRLTTLEAA